MFNVLNPHARRRRAAIGEKEEFMVSEDNTRSAGFLAENGNEIHRKVIAVRPFGSARYLRIMSMASCDDRAGWHVDRNEKTPIWYCISTYIGDLITRSPVNVRLRRSNSLCQIVLFLSWWLGKFQGTWLPQTEKLETNKFSHVLVSK